MIVSLIRPVGLKAATASSRVETAPMFVRTGGARAKPGEVSLAHNGVLFLDELPDFS